MAQSVSILTALQKTRVLFLAPTCGGSKLPVTQVPEDLTLSSGLCGQPHTYAYIQGHRFIHTKKQ